MQFNNLFMRKKQFNQILVQVEEIMGISKNVFLEKSKNRDHVEARDLLFYLCNQNNMRATTIQNFCHDLGYETDTSQISRGKFKIEKLISKDKEWSNLIKSI